MRPRILIISGGREGEQVPLLEELTIGREPQSGIVLSDPSVSRCHCLIKKERDRYKIVDMDSAAGTLVNNVPIKEHVLKHNDKIKVVTTDFIFQALDNAADVTVPNSIPVAERETLPLSATARADSILIDDRELDIPELFTLESKNSASELTSEVETALRVTNMLSALWRVSTSLNTTRELEPLAKTLLSSLLEVIPAQRGMVILLGSSEAEFTHQFSHYQEHRAEETNPIRLSKTIIRKVTREGVSVLASNVLASETYNVIESLRSAFISSLLVVPMIFFDEVIGMIYLDTRDLQRRFSDYHLRFVTAVAHMSAGVLEHARQMERVVTENQRLAAEINIRHELIGESKAIGETIRLIGKLARTDCTVLLRGESGTGKELAARAIHRNSTRASKPFLPINCAALPEPLLESELFGHEKGAFTGAVAQKKGMFEMADKGIVFLDEIGELSPAMQAKLLRVLQEKEVRRVGGTANIKIDVRIIAATHRDLESAIKDRSFREDLYYRLNVVPLTLPPLRQRREDIPLMISYFAKRLCKNRMFYGIEPEARARLLSYDWPGNVRELENAIEHALILSEDGRISPENLPSRVLDSSELDNSLSYFADEVKKAKRGIISKAIKQSGDNYAAAAQYLGMNLSNLRRLMRSIGMDIA